MSDEQERIIGGMQVSLQTVVSAVAELKQAIKEHASDTKADRKELIEFMEKALDKVNERIDLSDDRIDKHQSLIEQLKGAKYAMTGLVATGTTIGLGTLAKFIGVIR